MELSDSSIPKGVETDSKPHDSSGSELNDLLNSTLKELKKYDPLLQPGLWDSAVDRIRAIRTILYAQNISKQ